MSASAMSPALEHGVKRLGVVGAGQMGTGIALVGATVGKLPVVLMDRDEKQLAGAVSLVEKVCPCARCSWLVRLGGATGVSGIFCFE